MNIALIAHDNKKELMAQFCTAYCGILAQHTLCATATTGQIISDATGLTIHRFLSFSHGGLCDQNNIPYASNLASAEMLVLGLARGDLDWRNIVNPKTKPFTA